MNRPAEYLDNAATAQSRAVEPEGDARQGEGMSEIRESIRQTREDMTETIDELHERLSPSQVTQKVKEQVKEQYRQVRNTLRVATIGKVEDMAERIGDTVYATRRSIVETVSANPIPSALVGVGVAWLWMNRRRDHGGNAVGAPIERTGGNSKAPQAIRRRSAEARSAASSTR